jgi:Glyoxalase/Bleomycin resistance protein/Dioxygenase superfamily
VIKGELEAMVAGTAYGHIASVVDDLDATLAALAEQGIEPERPPYAVREGGSLLTFVRDPVNGYRIELHAPDQAGRSTARPRIAPKEHERSATSKARSHPACCDVAAAGNPGWSVCGAQRSQSVAADDTSEGPGNIDRQPDCVHESRALAVQPRTLEVLLWRRAAETLVERGTRHSSYESMPAHALSRFRSSI